MDERNWAVNIHNGEAGRIVREIVKPTIEAGGDIKDVLVLLESIVCGVTMFAVKIGGDNKVLDVFTEGVRLRMSEMRLGKMPTDGSA